MKNSLKAAVAVSGFFIAGAAMALPASAAGWMVWEGQNEAAPRIIYTDAADQAGAMLACNPNGQLLAMLTLEPVSIPDAMKLNAPYHRGSDSKVSVGDGEATEVTFRYTPARKTLESTSHMVGATVYNSAVTGETLKVETRHEGTVETTLPAPDATFKAFAKTCRDLREAASE